MQTHLVDLIFEAQTLGQGVQNIDGEAFVPLGLTQDVLGHHDEWILLRNKNRLFRGTQMKVCGFETEPCAGTQLEVSSLSAFHTALSKSTANHVR